MKFKIIKLSCGQRVKVSPDDFDYLSQFNWYKRKSCTSDRFVQKFYACRSEPRPSKKQIIMSREIMKCPPKKVVDHINGNTFNNTRENLRITSQSGNSMNSNKSKSPRMTSKYKGVSWHKKDKAWRARIKLNGKTIYIGNFKNEKEAAIAYNNFAKNIFKDFARINKV